MRQVSHVIVAVALAVTVAGCGEPYYPRYGSSQSYNAPSGYNYSQPYNSPSGYNYYPTRYGYNAPATYDYSSRSDYYRNYNGVHPGPERTFP